MAEVATVKEIFVKTNVTQDVQGPFGVCYVAYAGTHERRYRGERLLEVAAQQLRGAAEAAGRTVPQCLRRSAAAQHMRCSWRPASST